MDDRMLETLFVAQVVTLAHQIKLDKAARGVMSHDTYICDAIRMISMQRTEVLRILDEAQPVCD